MSPAAWQEAHDAKVQPLRGVLDQAHTAWEAFRADPEGYIDQYPMTPDQREAALNQEWNRLLELGGNIYYTSKLAAYHGINFQQLAGLMTGMGESYRAMMVGGGRSIEGNRFKSEWEDE